MSKKGKQVTLWNLEGHLLTTLKDDIGLTDVQFNPKDLSPQASDFPDDTEILATMTDNDMVKLWQPDGTFIKTLKDDKGLTRVNFSPMCVMGWI